MMKEGERKRERRSGFSAARKNYSARFDPGYPEPPYHHIERERTTF